jgi:dephospho-CoA kinase
VANPVVQQQYLAVKRHAEQAADGSVDAYVAAKEPWFSDAYRQAWNWAGASGWRPKD